MNSSIMRSSPDAYGNLELSDGTNHHRDTSLRDNGDEKVSVHGRGVVINMDNHDLDRWKSSFQNQQRRVHSRNQFHVEKEQHRHRQQGQGQAHPHVPSPSSLMSYSAPRKTVSRIGMNGASGVSNESFSSSNENVSPNVSPHGRKRFLHKDDHDVYPDAHAYTDTDSSFGPFRDRFASAAIISQSANASVNSSFEQQQRHLHSQPVNVPNHFLNVSDGNIDVTQRRSNMRDDEDYVSFGNQSVFSDITGGESYIENTSSRSDGSQGSPSMASRKSLNSGASRDMRRKARQSKSNRGNASGRAGGRNGHGQGHHKHHSQSNKPLHQVEEEDGYLVDGVGGEIGVPQVTRKRMGRDFGTGSSSMEHHTGRIASPSNKHDVTFGGVNAQTQRGKKLSMRLASFFANRSQSRTSPTNANGDNHFRSTSESDHDRRPKSQPRSNSHFRSRSSPNENNDGFYNSGRHNHGSIHDKDNRIGLVGRSVSVPKERSTSRIRAMASSPTRSHASESESSGGYMSIRWPGTLDKNGKTVVETASFHGNSDGDDDRPALNRSFMNKTRVARKSPSPIKDRKNTFPYTQSASMDGRSKVPVVGVNGDTGKGATMDMGIKELQNPNHIIASRVRSNRIADLKRQFEKDRPQIVDLDKKPTSDALSLEPRPADYHLAAALTEVKSSKYPRSQMKEKQNRSMELEMERSFEREGQNLNHSFPGAGGSVRDSFSRSSPLHFSHNNTVGTTERTNASTILHPRVNQNMSLDIERTFEADEQALNHSFPGAKGESTRRSARNSHPKIDTSASLRRVQSAGRDVPGLGHKTNQPQSTEPVAPGSPKYRLSEAALKENDRVSPKLQNFAHGANVRGYRGFIDKTAEVPNLIDDVDSITSASTMATERRPEYSTDTESDVFDGVSSVNGRSYVHHGKHERMHQPLSPTFERLREKYSIRRSPQGSPSDQVSVVKMNNAMISIQATRDDVERRKTAAEFDASLTDSDTDHAAQRRRSPRSILPGHYDPLASRKTLPPISDDESSFDSRGANASEDDVEKALSPNDLSKYAVESLQVRRLVKAYRHLSSRDPSEEEGAKKAFALFEMRSRIMVSDIERGFERAGGTITVDDLVLTSFYKAACRVRDAVIVSKAWRDGASPQDARTASNLMKNLNYRIRRDRPQMHSMANHHIGPQVEEIAWIDDTEFSLIRCFGSKTLRGSDIFTTGDCQSLLLKLTHEHCEQLRQEHKESMARQIIAEKLMTDDGGGHTSTMTEAELEYLEAMEEAETVTKKLDQAEKAFEMVKGQIEGLVRKYEDILEQIDNESISTSSFDSAAGDDESLSSNNSKDRKDKMARRVQRAELKAEVAAREAQIAKIEAEKSKQEAAQIRRQKESELSDLRQKLEDLEAKSSIMLSDFEAKLKSQTLLNNPVQKRVKFANDSSIEAATSPESMLYAASSVGTDPDQNEAKARIKARFRERRKISSTGDTKQESRHTTETGNKTKLSGRVHQRLQFYERSLQSIQQKDLSTRTL